MGPTLVQLRAFVAVVDAGGFSAAAAALGLGQPTLSTHLRNLEAEVGTSLLDRSARALRLTTAGEILLADTREILALTEAALDRVDRVGTRPVSGTLRIGGTSTAGERYLPEQLSSFLGRYPGVKVELSISNTSDVIDGLTTGTLAVAVVAGLHDAPTLTTTPVGHEEQIVIVAGDHVLAGQSTTPSELRGTTILVREAGSSTRRYQDELIDSWRIRGAVVNTIASTSGIINAVAAGLGIACVPAVAARDALTLGRVAALGLDPRPPDRPLTLIRKRDRPLNRVEELFLDHLERSSEE